MTISSKFNLRQRIYWLEDNRVKTAVIKAIQFPRVYNDKSLNGEECMVTPTKTTKKVLSRILAFRQMNTVKLTEYGKN